MTHRRELHDGWTVQAARGPVPAELSVAVMNGAVPAAVPGCVHTDLLSANLIPHPYQGENEALLAWIGRVDWTYSTSFEWAPDGEERHDLVFEGVDTVAGIWLNGTHLGSVANQHRSYRFAVDEYIREGANAIEVRFTAPLPYANAQSLELGSRPRPYPLPFEAIRKSAANFGWDWGIATFTSGLWRPVRLESWSVARLAEVRVVATPDGDGGAVSVVADIERATSSSDVDVRLQMTIAGPGIDSTIEASADFAASENRADTRLELPAVERWWPIGHGAQPRYSVSIDIQGEGAMRDSALRVVGFRTVEWDTAPDEQGAPFTLVVNDRPIFVKGVNWIPDDALPVRVDRARYERRLRQAVDANVNLVRVWGGGVYESDDFYDLCDELGLLTWQDFLFACAAYPEEEPIRSEVEAEARDNIVRLASHPSLVLLTGNNENLWGFEDWGWKQRLEGKSWGAYYYYDLFPRLIAELAPHVPYAPGSPFSPGTTWDGEVQNGPHPNDERHGSTHLWDQWNRKDWLTYRDHTPRFVAEFGWQGPPTWTTLTTWLDDDPLTPESPGMILHQKATEGNVKLETGLLPHFRVPGDMETWHWAMQLNQAIAVGTALEHFRSHAPHTMGAVVWQLNDCWPVISWAAVDGDERPKPLYYAMRNAFAPRLVTIQPRDEGLTAVVVNDSDTPWSGTIHVARRDMSGGILADSSMPVSLRAYSSIGFDIDASVADAGDAASELLTAELDDVRGVWFFTEPRDSNIPPAVFDLDVVDAGDGVDVTITARSLVRDLTFLVDKVDPGAVAVDGLMTLLPGEVRIVHLRGLSSARAAELRHPRVARTTNELVDAG
ncbi:glycoside hydrolase family 2 protein [Salinibacterium sp. G-O1]|uniref:glycoside hydrolase family 2 protein n=1 Tax=Salinibacterium sp. G-O1 TaxID=3046208 RepID=UPI0024BA2430|nr:sugar-binding domain-containing protein [Salinibacterium sp. G-O1]MDJ0334944.1 glycoside hydrolase family 2 protein [Salinibacterium sp. G-O1]